MLIQPSCLHDIVLIFPYRHHCNLGQVLAKGKYTGSWVPVDRNIFQYAVRKAFLEET